MTMQVGLVGTDGIVLASDEKTLFFDEIQTSGLTTKIMIGRGMVLAYSGYEISGKVARRILDDQTISDFDQQGRAVEGLAAGVYKEPFPELIQPLRRDSEILIVSDHNLNHFYSLEMNDQRCSLRARKDKAVAGHKPSTACFFLERYYTRAPISVLAFLAAHVILMANKLNPLGVEGLEIVSCKNSGFERESGSAISAFISKSNTIDEDILKKIYSE